MSPLSLTVRTSLFKVYVFSSFVMVFCVNVPAPLFLLFKRQSGAGPGGLAMLYTVYAATVIAALPISGRFSDRWGRKSLVIAGLGLISVGSAVLCGAQDFSALITGRCLQGLGVAAMSGSATSTIAELVGPQAYASAASIVAISLAVGGAVGPLLSGALAEAVPNFPMMPLLLCSALSLISLMAVLRLPEPPYTGKITPPTSCGSHVGAHTPVKNRSITLLGHGTYRKAFLQACTTVIVCFGIQTTFFTVSGPLFGSLLVSHVLLSTGCSMAALMSASAIGGRLSRCMPTKTSIGLSMGLLSVGMCAFFGFAGSSSITMLIPSILVIGTGHGVGYAGAIRLINETAPANSRATYTSKFYVAVYVGGGLPVLVDGVLERALGQAIAFQIFAAVMTSIALCLAMTFYQRPSAAIRTR